MSMDMRTGALSDGTDPTTIGTELHHDDDEQRYETLVDRVAAADNSMLIAWFARAGYGTLAPIDDDRRRAWDLPAQCAGLIEWNDGNEQDNRTMLVMLDRNEMARIVDENECVTVDKVVRHYKWRTDDGHPAYRLRRIHDAYRTAHKAR